MHETDQIDNNSSKSLPRLGRERFEDVAGVVLKQFERHGEVMVLEHWFVVVHQRQLRTYSPPAGKNPASFNSHQASTIYRKTVICKTTSSPWTDV